MTSISKKTGTFKSFDDTEIYFEVRGRGTPLVFVYGLACQMNHWHFQTEYFSKNYQVITFDLRGHHKSAQPISNENLKIESLSEDLFFLLKHLEISHAHFLGHSFGVPILVEFSKKYQDRVLSFSFVNGFVKNPIKDMFGMPLVENAFRYVQSQYSNNSITWDMIWKNVVDNPVSAFFTGLVGGFNLKLTPFQDIEIYLKGVAQVPLSVFIGLFDSMMDFDGEKQLPLITKPTLVVAGEKDHVTPISRQEVFRNNLKDHEFVVVPYGSHCTQLDFPDYLNLKIDQHLHKAHRP